MEGNEVVRTVEKWFGARSRTRTLAISKSGEFTFPSRRAPTLGTFVAGSKRTEKADDISCRDEKVWKPFEITAKATG
jgi:hypothetical protein